MTHSQGFQTFETSRAAGVESEQSPRLVRLVLIAAALCEGCGYFTRPGDLSAAARDGDLDAIDRLVDAGADLNAQDGAEQWPPVLHAVQAGQAAALERLVGHGAFIHGETGRQAMAIARRCGHREILRLLLARGVLG